MRFDNHLQSTNLLPKKVAKRKLAAITGGGAARKGGAGPATACTGGAGPAASGEGAAASTEGGQTGGDLGGAGPSP
jgi:hypothetical protein